MPGSLSWLDYSEYERRKALDLVSVFAERDTRDELGLGTIRDAFADTFFPGTSTIMTRAKYFLFVPWMYLELERKGVPSLEISTKIRRKEIDLIDPLVRSDSQGAIGRVAGRNLKRLPSEIYWQGLGIWGIRLFPGSQDQYHRWLDVFYRKDNEIVWSDDRDPVGSGPLSNWHPSLPPAPPDLEETASFAFTRTESQYLVDRITLRCPGTLIAFLVAESSDWEPVDFSWEHPNYGSFPLPIRSQLVHAQNFSEVMWGAAIFYNLLLAEAVPDDELVVYYRGQLDKWADILVAHSGALQAWNLSDFWRITRRPEGLVSPPTRLFVEAWIQLALRGRPKDLVKNQAARSLIAERERLLKGDRGRLINRRCLEIWGGAAGTAQLDYRWGVNQRIIQDILKGLHAEG